MDRPTMLRIAVRLELRMPGKPRSKPPPKPSPEVGAAAYEAAKINIFNFNTF
jgi:hypothetical protein